MSQRFVEDFLDQWLEHEDIDANTPDEKLYPEYDDVLRQSMLEETRRFFSELIWDDRGVREFIDSDFTFLNRRLAEHYGIPGVEGLEFRKVNLPADSRRGGILTQASVLKVTANGTNTSPVPRGRFVLANLLGTPPSPPPPSAGAIEPDTRGTTPIPEDVADKADLVGRIELLFQLVPLIVQTDSSRVISIVIQNNHGIPLVNGVASEHHNLSHHGRDAKKIVQLKKIERAILGCFDGLMHRMKEHREAGATLLDHTMTILGSNLGNAAAHDPRNNPIIFAGGGLNHGGYVSHRRDDNTPLCNLFVRVLQEIGVEADAFATSSSVLSW